MDSRQHQGERFESNSGSSITRFRFGPQSYDSRADLDSVFLSGHSAGAHLASLVAVDPKASCTTASSPVHHLCSLLQYLAAHQVPLSFLKVCSLARSRLILSGSTGRDFDIWHLHSRAAGREGLQFAAQSLLPVRCAALRSALRSLDVAATCTPRVRLAPTVSALVLASPLSDENSTAASKWPEASPITHVRAGASTPPFLVLNASSDLGLVVGGQRSACFSSLLSTSER